MDNFVEFKLKLDAYDLQAWGILKTNIVLVVHHWCRKEYLEPSWVVKDGKPMAEEEFTSLVYDNFRANYDELKGSIDTYASLKVSFIEVANQQLSLGFDGFFAGIKQCQDNAWKHLDKRLRPILKAWLVNKGETSQEAFDKIYAKTLYVFIEKLQKESLNYDNSRSLKSYLIRISEYILKEYRRQTNTDRFVKIEDSNLTEMSVIQVIQIEKKQEKEQVKNLLNMLNIEEKKILYSFYFLEIKLKDIAQLLDVTEEACRVKKHRALKKLQDHLTRVPYFND